MKIDNRTFLAAGVIIALLIGVMAVFFASGDPDGLESTALVVQGEKTITGAAPEHAEIQKETVGRFSYSAPMEDYSFSETMGPLGGIIAIGLGTILAFLAVLGIIYAIKKVRPPLQNQ